LLLTPSLWRAFSRQVFAEGALPAKTKDLIAIAVAHVTPCPYCIRAHTKSALAKGAMEKEITEAMWVAAEMRAGGAVAHSALAIDVMKEHVEAYCWIGILLDEKGRRRVTAKQCQGPARISC
jgi:AhpD family alkylhydroperoxidase